MSMGLDEWAAQLPAFGETSGAMELRMGGSMTLTCIFGFLRLLSQIMIQVENGMSG
jgi:hypothetical protein